MKIEVYTKWLFPDNLPAEGFMFEFCEVKPYIKNGKEVGQVFVLLGQDKNGVGDFQIFPSKIKNLKELINTYGLDSEKWALRKFLVKPSEDKLVFSPI